MFPYYIVVYGSGYVTECYVQEDSPFIETSTPAVTKVRTRSPLMEDSFALPYNGSGSPSMGDLRARRPVSKECSRIKDNLDISRKKTSKVHPHESGFGGKIAHSRILDTANITQVSAVKLCHHELLWIIVHLQHILMSWSTLTKSATDNPPSQCQGTSNFDYFDIYIKGEFTRVVFTAFLAYKSVCKKAGQLIDT